ncbi:MAG: energy-coupling factor ABC transporter ATP-binding protein [Alphaproteobacteria bacterium]
MNVQSDAGLRDGTGAADRSRLPGDLALELKNVTYVREGRTVLSSLSLTSHARRIGLVGRNGSGKSSLARLLVGLDAPTSGSVRIFGGDVFSDRDFALQQVGIIFQNPDQQIIFPTVGEEVHFGLESLGVTGEAGQQRMRGILARFGVEDWEEMPVRLLSHGQKHLVCLMSVLAMEPQLIVFDEPYTSLDIPTAARMRQILYGLQQHLVLISHNLADFDEFDEMIWLDDGRLEVHGDRDDVLPRFIDGMDGEVR